MAPFLSRRNRFPILVGLWVFLSFMLYRTWNGGLTLRQSQHGERYPPIYVDKLPQGAPRSLPRLQADFGPETAEARAEREGRQAAVRERFAQSWKSYRELAYGADELLPLTGGTATSFGGWGATLVDSLDSLWILGMKDEFDEAVRRVADINFNRTQVKEINVFETTIRYMGGLLGAYDVSGGRYQVLLDKAVEIGDMIYRAFDTPNRMPITRWHLRDGHQTASNRALLAEIASFTLEFTRLSQVTGNGKYYDAVYRVAKVMEKHQQKTKLPGLWPILVDAANLRFDFNIFTLGGMADSAFEYLPKMSALIGGNEPMYQNMYERTIKASKERLFFRPMLPDNADILISGSSSVIKRTPYLDSQGQHLTCFAGGMVLMGAKLYGRTEEIETGKKLTDGCVWAYDSMPSGIMPEVFRMLPCKSLTQCEWDEDAWVQEVLEQIPPTKETESLSHDERARYVLMTEKLVRGYTRYDDKKYMLRPEAIESVFFAYRLTGDSKYREAAWRMFLAIDQHTRTKLAHAGLIDVTTEHPEKDNKMESFWFAETLKYFYLIFSDPEHVSLDRYVLNTEAHTFLRPGAEWKEAI